MNDGVYVWKLLHTEKAYEEAYYINNDLEVTNTVLNGRIEDLNETIEYLQENEKTDDESEDEE